jgi:hypothetical protein
LNVIGFGAYGLRFRVKVYGSAFRAKDAGLRAYGLELRV